MRKAHNNGTLSQDGINKLESIKLDWVVRDEVWEERLEQLKGFKEANGHCRVPRSHPGLGVWVNTQRNKYNNGTLSQDRIDKLKHIGFEWVLRDRDPSKPARTS